MTLMEVILAIAILGGSLAILGEMVRVGARASRSARLLSTAQILADSIAAEIAAGAALPESTEGVVEQFGESSWAYTVQVDQGMQQGLLSILVTVYDNLDQSGKPTTYTVMRWMIDPQLELDLEMAAAEAEAATAAAAGDSSGSTGTSSAGTDAGSMSSGASGGGR
jgi:hypothetical protein